MENKDNLPEVKHLLQKHSVLASFNISKSITQKDIDSVYDKLKVNPKNDQMKDVARRMVESMKALDYCESKNIPGIITYENTLKQGVKGIDKKKMAELLGIANIFTQTLLQEGLTPHESAYTLGIIIRNLNLNDPNLFRGFDTGEGSSF